MSPYHWFTAREQHEADRRRNPKLGPWNGPIAQAYISLEDEPIVLNILDSGDMYRIARLDLSRCIGVATQGVDRKWHGQHQRFRDPIQKVHLRESHDSLEGVQQAIRDNYLREKEEELRIAASPVLRLERILRERDWYGHMSDDHAYWSAAVRNDRQLKEITPLVPQEDFRRLWQQYAPQDCKCPV